MLFDQLSANVTASRHVQKTRNKNKGEILSSHVSVEPESLNQNWEHVCISKQKIEIQQYTAEKVQQRDIQWMETQASGTQKDMKYTDRRLEEVRWKFKGVGGRSAEIHASLPMSDQRAKEIQESTGKAFLSITHPSPQNKTTTSSSRWSSG